MNLLLENIFATRTFLTTNHEEVKIHSETSKTQCDFLQQIIRDNHFSKSVEIGFAHGISTLAITEEIVKNEGHHVVIDKFEISGWKGVGLDLLAQAGFANNLDFHEEYCYIVLPKLLEQGKRFDFAYVDSTKQFDWLLVDFFYLDKLLEKNGVIVFDDVCFPGIKKLMRYISQFPNYKVYGTYPANREVGAKRKMLSALKILPGASKLIKEDVLISDFTMGINANCVALQKTSDDTRDWTWHKDF